jgi:hypothetical protein
MNIEITRTETTLHVVTPFHPDFPRKAKALGGKWHADSKAWQFDARDEKRVRDALVAIYGTDGTPTELVTVLVRTGADFISANCKELYVAGRMIANRAGRDFPARLGEGVIQLGGLPFPEIGGSMKAPRLTWDSDIRVFELKDAPRLAAEQAMSTYPSCIEITSEAAAAPEPTDPQADGRAWGKAASKRLRKLGKRNCAGLSKQLFAAAARNQGRGQVWYLAAAFGVLEGR